MSDGWCFWIGCVPEDGVQESVPDVYLDVVPVFQRRWRSTRVELRARMVDTANACLAARLACFSHSLGRVQWSTR